MLKKITHPKPSDAFDLYVTIPWEAKCEAVSKIRIELKEGRVITLPRLAAVGATGELTETVESEGANPAP